MHSARQRGDRLRGGRGVSLTRPTDSFSRPERQAIERFGMAAGPEFHAMISRPESHVLAAEYRAQPQRRTCLASCRDGFHFPCHGRAVRERRAGPSIRAWKHVPWGGRREGTIQQKAGREKENEKSAHARNARKRSNKAAQRGHGGGVEELFREPERTQARRSVSARHR